MGDRIGKENGGYRIGTVKFIGSFIFVRVSADPPVSVLCVSHFQDSRHPFEIVSHRLERQFQLVLG